MKAAVVHETDGQRVLTFGEVPDPDVGEQDVLIDVAAISIEGGDLGVLEAAPVDWLPFVPGFSASGTVAAVGSGVTRFTPGDRVATFSYSGSHAGQRVVPQGYVYPVPDGVDLDLASTVPVAFGTAGEALFTAADVEPGDTVLVRGATGGVGLAAVEIAHDAEATVIATASSQEAAEKLRELGADHAILYRDEDVKQRTLELTGGTGVDLLLELVGGSVFPDLLSAMAMKGRIVGIGASSGSPAQLTLQELGARQLTATAVFYGGQMHTGRAHSMIADHFAALADGTFSMPIDRVFPLSEAVEAHRYAGTAHPFGRVLLRP